MKKKANRKTLISAAYGGTQKSLLSTKEAAKYLGFASKQLENLRSHNKGPVMFKKENNKCYYKVNDLDIWLAANRKNKKNRRVNTTRQVIKEVDKSADESRRAQMLEEHRRQMMHDDSVRNSRYEYGRSHFIASTLALLGLQLSKRKSYYLGAKQDSELLKSFKALIFALMEEIETLKQWK